MVSMAGVCLPLPEAEPLVDPFRREHDWTYEAGLSAHVTVRMPFPSEFLLEPQTVSSVIDEFLPMEVVLARLEDREGGLVVLVEPDAQLRRLTNAIGDACTGLPPHREGQRFAYHVTVVRTGDPEIRNDAAKAIETRLPLVAVGRELWRFDWEERDLGVTWKATA